MGDVTTPAGRPATVAELLNAAADRIRDYGWVQDNWYLGPFSEAATTAVCADGAMCLSYGHDPREYPEVPQPVELARKTLADHVDPSWNPRYRTAAGVIQAWNDNPDRTQAQVVEALREAARAAA